ncbi:hypothetical protein I315_02141 [Cryptococcus gattii Ru294]|uniref:Uncharacterized protein n=2 Tax=Cryptococcus gattii TaxID=37769 RepID=E6R3A2_CRYGW|nr:Hypothetical Protein CGB_C3540C [Cryptococcus gattii WM276]KIR55552.1 hypothetical protein I315_02141 [Cryptococcus gattii Ru294]KIR82140.1 hypothetical protein I306_00784 [Cryptococcus gattii EJB2]KIY31142.1 hypothetical protein I305_06431 [Cryptococcus gattii E566]KJE02085.1 hypothetical protein I311_04293 [Cryptococcus gattii NT-10]ADV20967.1 Hypothetical Protein CGB_C3540C [Cryptococcus gattii WM276]
MVSGGRHHGHHRQRQPDLQSRQRRTTTLSEESHQEVCYDMTMMEKGNEERHPVEVTADAFRIVFILRTSSASPS